MSQVSVSIDGKMFRMACEDGQEAHLEALALHLDTRIGEMRQAFGEIGDLRLVVMAAITIADEVSESRRKISALQAEIETLKAQSSSARDDAGSRAEEIAALIEGMAGRVERLVGLLAQKPDL